MTLTFSRGHRSTHTQNCDKFELVQSFSCKVTWSIQNFWNGWLSKEDDCRIVLYIWQIWIVWAFSRFVCSQSSLSSNSPFTLFALSFFQRKKARSKSRSRSRGRTTKSRSRSRSRGRSTKSVSEAKQSPSRSSRKTTSKTTTKSTEVTVDKTDAKEDTTEERRVSRLRSRTKAAEAESSTSKSETVAVKESKSSEGKVLEEKVEVFKVQFACDDDMIVQIAVTVSFTNCLDVVLVRYT